jgi:hypothetical protein
MGLCLEWTEDQMIEAMTLLFLVAVIVGIDWLSKRVFPDE